MRNYLSDAIAKVRGANRVPIVLGSILALSLHAQTSPGTSRIAGAVDLQTDSSEYAVRYADGAYAVTIGYVFENHQRTTVSSNYCRTPYPPTLEKNLGGDRWVLAYGEVSLSCKSEPPFRVAPKGVYRAALSMYAAGPGLNRVPRLQVDSIDGRYRLHWRLTLGRDPDLAGAPLVDVYSPPFRLRLRDKPQR